MNKFTAENKEQSISLLALAALGVVFGDIGTSPLYALRECFSSGFGVALSSANILSVLSLVFWSLIIVISVKYVLYVMRADNRGEGGDLALLALANKGVRRRSLGSRFILIVGLCGTSLLYGDSMITPAISVLSAVEGLAIAAPRFEPYVVQITLVILFLLFLFQKQGTAKIGQVFGPVMLIWFLVLAVLGLHGIAQQPSVLEALNPFHALGFAQREGVRAFFVLGSVFLVMTGGEALFADMGHFGRRPIRMVWFGVALPGLCLNYFGQGAILIQNPKALDNPFYLLAPGWAVLPLVVLATVATVIASQAVITGAFSITRQAVQLGFLPRVKIRHTSSEQIGQIYVPIVNRILLLATIGLVLGFQTSAGLASAYGIAVSTSMMITTLLMFFVSRRVWKWPWYLAIPVTGFFLLFDLSFFSANLAKVGNGGWVPLAVGLLLFVLMSTWKRGRDLLADRYRPELKPFDEFLNQLAEQPPIRVPGTVVFFTRSDHGVPFVLQQYLMHNHVLHEQTLLLTISSEEVPRIEPSGRLEVKDLGGGFYRVVAKYGFMESPSISHILELCLRQGLDFDLGDLTFFLGREAIIPVEHRYMSRWRKSLFAFMAHNAERPTEFFEIPSDQVVEIGMQIKI